MANDKKKYNKMEEVLKKINNSFVTLNKTEKLKTTPILECVISNIIDRMKQINPLFANMYECLVYSGSYYDDLKVGKADEFDIDLKMVLPKLLEARLIMSNQPGFVKIHLSSWEKLEKNPIEYQKFKELADLKDKENFLLQNKILFWMESIVTRALNNYSSGCIPYNGGQIQVKYSKGGPAITLIIDYPPSDISVSVDLVASFKCKDEQWLPKPYRPLPPGCTKKEFLIVPKCPKGDINEIRTRLWRVSFQEQEREMIRGKERFKPALRLLKKFRDTQNQGKMASYFLKTIFLHELIEPDDTLWDSPLSYVFMHMLKQYQGCLEKQQIDFFWYKKNNLLKQIDEKTLEIYKHSVKKIINTIESKLENNPEIVAEYILTTEEISGINKNILPELFASTSFVETAEVKQEVITPEITSETIELDSDVTDSSSKLSLCISPFNLQPLNNNTLENKLNLIIHLLENQNSVVQKDIKNIYQKINNIEESIGEIKKDNKFLKSKLSNQFSSESSVDSWVNFHNVETRIYPNLKDSNAIFSNEQISDSLNRSSPYDFNMLQDKLLQIEKTVDVLKSENALLKNALRAFVINE